MRARAAFCAVLLLATAARADENGDLDRIPPAPDATPTQTNAASGFTGNFYLQDDAAIYDARSDLLVPLPPSRAPSWEERLFLDGRIGWDLGSGVSLHYSGRFDLRAEDTLDFPSHENIRHDLREAYLAWDTGANIYLEAGRINLKSGVALCFNPTDFFKTRAVVEPTSADPSVLREDRLGTLMLLGEGVWNGFSLSLALAPKVAQASAIYTNNDLPSFDPMFDRTNAQDRFLAKASVRLAEDLNPEVLVYAAGGETLFGFDLTRAFGKSLVGYVEWSGGDRASLVHDALAYGIDTGSLPPSVGSVLPHSMERSFRNSIALGAEYATPDEVSFNLEYHYDQAGFTGEDWRNWFAAGIGADDATRGALWYIRGYASDQQQPVSRSSVFLRADWENALVRDLSFAGFVEANTRDGSVFGQLSVNYNLTDAWSVSALVDTSFGRKRSDFGSNPGATSALIRVSRYFLRVMCEIAPERSRVAAIPDVDAGDLQIPAMSAELAATRVSGTVITTILTMRVHSSAAGDETP